MRRKAFGTDSNNGTILANVAGGALTILPNGSGVTNHGIFQAETGSTLNVGGDLANYNPATSTLTGGTYNAFFGTIKLYEANADIGKGIATNGATIFVDGGTARIGDGGGNDILSNYLATNTAAGRFSIRNGANLTTASTGFTNAGAVKIDASSTFRVGGSHDYVQTGGITTLAHPTAALVVAAGHAVDIQGGRLEGFGTIQGNLINDGVVHPGDGPGILTATGNYTQGALGHLAIEIGGPDPGFFGYSQLSIGGTAALDGILDLRLIDGFTPYNGETFAILLATDLSGVFARITGLEQGNVRFTVKYGVPELELPGEVMLTAFVASVPEPGSMVLLVLGVAGVGAYAAGSRWRKARH